MSVMACINFFLKTCGYVNAHKNMPLEISFMYLDKKGIYSTFKT